MGESLPQILLILLLVKHNLFFLILFPSYSVSLTIFTIAACPPPKFHKLLKRGNFLLNHGKSSRLVNQVYVLVTGHFRSPSN